MGILLKKIRVHGFRGLENVEIDFEPTTVLVGTNNVGKTTLLKSLQLAFTNSLQINDDDFYFSDIDNCDKIIIDVLIISVDDHGNQIPEFEDKWSMVFHEDRITFDDDGNQIVAFRTVVEENLIRKTFKKKQFIIDSWGLFSDENDELWYNKVYENELSFYFDEIPFFYLDANRDILDDLKSKTSYLGRILSSIEYEEKERETIEELIKELNKITIESSEVLTSLHSTLVELDTAMDNPNNTIDITPFTKKLRDLNKGIKINYSHFSMEYHGMGTRSWSSLLVLKAFINQNLKIANEAELAYYPIIAIEEPESHLHPNAQKKLYTQINSFVGQKIVSTHSSYIAGSAKLKEIRSLIKSESINIGKIKVDDLSPEEIRKIYRQVINTRGELYFSKAIIFCEGETEEQALPLLLKKYFSKSSIELGIDIVGIDGGGNYFPFIKFCHDLNINWYILSDGESAIIKKIKKDLKKLFNLNDNINDIEIPDNVKIFENEHDFESYLIECNYKDEIKNTLKSILNIEDLSDKINQLNGTVEGRAKTDELCETCNQNIFIDQIRDYTDENGENRALCYLLSQNKTRYPSLLSESIYNSDKELPPVISDLFSKINNDLMSNNHE